MHGLLEGVLHRGHHHRLRVVGVELLLMLEFGVRVVVLIWVNLSLCHRA